MSTSFRSIYQSGRRLVRRLAHVIALPVRKDYGKGGVLIQPYRGYGSADELFLVGRVFQQPRLASRLNASFANRDLLDVIRRVFRKGVGNATLTVKHDSPTTVNVAIARVQTDRDGYFRARLQVPRRPSPDKQWHQVEFQLVAPTELADDAGVRVQGHVFVPSTNAVRVIISDIDDTVMLTGVVNKLKMMWRLFVLGPESRVAFPGVAALYRGLYNGPSQTQFNPMLYVSRGPWSIYEILQEFFRLHRIPVGPILFLREWGMSLQRPFPPPAEDHKLNLIRDMLSLYHDLPFVLIGDSGQHDPEIYAQIVQENPGRVEAVYIRNVSRSDDRVRAIEELAKQVVSAGSSLMLAPDSFAMARHAAEHGLISRSALQEVLLEQQSEHQHSRNPKTREVKQRTQGQTRRAVDQGAIRNALETRSAGDVPPSVSVESEEDR
ncbi:App1 family protein [Neorhodopirellula pilleata]|uniref:Phosphatidate phosphatase APP1 catalytic domain-containing protein n=1 Tax=Neorhodopirellula pilleata TaxID=2714738 RepID=A0A5C5ZL73_9BACT|nr:phosphatase domain-containing protein [Neorhodopirellula pilleata]TWT87915.1 hypothetical protein Pla100_58640 [Neorhodopirellula pilleata]